MISQLESKDSDVTHSLFVKALTRDAPATLAAHASRRDCRSRAIGTILALVGSTGEWTFSELIVATSKGEQTDSRVLYSDHVVQTAATHVIPDPSIRELEYSQVTSKKSDKSSKIRGCMRAVRLIIPGGLGGNILNDNAITIQLHGGNLNSGP